MVVSDRPAEGAPTRGFARMGERGPELVASMVTTNLPVLVSGAVILGLALAIALAPVGSGDYGQWLMTSRYYLGESVPAYRDLGQVPPLMPMLLAGIQVVLPDPVLALRVLTTLLLVGLGVSLYAVAVAAIGSRWAGAMAVLVGLLVTDRFTELFAFGGLLQVASLTFLTLAVAAFVRAADAPMVRSSWWIGTVALALSALTHVGTGLMAVPAGGLVAVLASISLFEHLGRDTHAFATRIRPVAIALGIVAGYWLVVLVAGGADYVANPASLSYRGPDRLFEQLFSRWPTALVVVIGSGALVLGAIRAVVLRRVDGYLLVAAWAAVTWGLLAYAILGGSATDYPRFAPPLLAPLVVGAAAALYWGLQRLGSSLADMGAGDRTPLVVAVAVVGATLITGPLAIDRFNRQADFYSLRDANALAAAAAWIGDALDESEVVLADSRDAKWLEGLTGRAALFSQPVRYSFRPAEWQRSADADALLRSTMGVTSGYMSGMFTGASRVGTATVPTGLLVRANHGGEFVDILRMPASGTQIAAGEATLTGASLTPVRATQRRTDREASIRTVWGMSGDPAFSFTQTVTAYRDGTTMRVTHSAPGHALAMELEAAPGVAITSLEASGPEAVACFTSLGGTAPCVRINAIQPGALVTSTPDGLRITSGGADSLDVLITALTAGDAAIGHAVLDPGRIASSYAVGAALLRGDDPAYDVRRDRLGRIGLEEVAAFGPYRVLARTEGR